MKSFLLRSLIGTSGLVMGIGGLCLGGMMAHSRENSFSKRNILSAGTVVASGTSVFGSFVCFYSGNCGVLYFGLGAQSTLILISYLTTHR